jgi:hypothetical protein
MANSKAGPRCRLGGGEWKLRTVTTPGKSSELKVVWRQDEGEKLIGTWKAEEPKTEISFRTPTGKHGVICLEGANLEIVSLWHKPDRTEELIEGKGLSGWKLVPGKKSKAFTTLEGWNDRTLRDSVTNLNHHPFPILARTLGSLFQNNFQELRDSVTDWWVGAMEGLFGFTKCFYLQRIAVYCIEVGGLDCPMACVTKCVIVCVTPCVTRMGVGV